MRRLSVLQEVKDTLVLGLHEYSNCFHHFCLMLVKSMLNQDSYDNGLLFSLSAILSSIFLNRPHLRIRRPSAPRFERPDPRARSPITVLALFVVSLFSGLRTTDLTVHVEAFFV